MGQLEPRAWVKPNFTELNYHEGKKSTSSNFLKKAFYPSWRCNGRVRASFTFRNLWDKHFYSQFDRELIIAPSATNSPVFVSRPTDLTLEYDRTCIQQHFKSLNYCLKQTEERISWLLEWPFSLNARDFYQLQEQVSGPFRRQMRKIWNRSILWGAIPSRSYNSLPLFLATLVTCATSAPRTNRNCHISGWISGSWHVRHQTRGPIFGKFLSDSMELGYYGERKALFIR